MTEAAEEFIEEIEELLGDPKFNFAKSTLTGIQTTVRNTGVVSDQQRAAIRNITNSVLPGRGDHPNWKRRYEGLYRWGKG